MRSPLIATDSEDTHHRGSAVVDAMAKRAAEDTAVVPCVFPFIDRQRHPHQRRGQKRKSWKKQIGLVQLGPWLLRWGGQSVGLLADDRRRVRL